MELIEYARKGNIMNIKEKYYIYQFKQFNELTEEWKSIKKIITSMSDIALRYEYKPTRASQGTKV
jgi:hypothetical protein